MDNPTPCIPLAPINPIHRLMLFWAATIRLSICLLDLHLVEIFFSSSVCRILIKNWALAVMLSQMDFLIAYSVDQDKVKDRSELNELTFPCLLHRK